MVVVVMVDLFWWFVMVRYGMLNGLVIRVFLDFVVFIKLIGNLRMMVGFGLLVVISFRRWKRVVGVLLMVMIVFFNWFCYNFMVVVDFVVLRFLVRIGIFGLLSV